MKPVYYPYEIVLIAICIKCGIKESFICDDKAAKSTFPVSRRFTQLKYLKECLEAYPPYSWMHTRKNWEDKLYCNKCQLPEEPTK